MSRGGARPGAGRKKKSELQRILEGKISKISVGKTFSQEELSLEICPEPHSYMAKMTKNSEENLSKQIYDEIYEWLKKRKCEHLVQAQLIEQYALNFARYAQAETAIHQFGLLAKHPTNGGAVPSPFIEISHAYMKQSQAIWFSIYSLVEESCKQYIDESSPQNDMMEFILSGKFREQKC